MRAKGKPDREQNKTGKHEPERDEFEPLNRRQQRQHGSKFMEFQIVLLCQKHSRRNRAESKCAISEKNHRGVKADETIGKIRLQSVRRIERRHEREHADAEENRRCKCSEEPQLMRDANDEINCNNCPREERRCFVKIIDRATVERKTAPDHRRRLQRGGGEEQEIIHMVVPAKTASPKENRIHRACAKNRHGEKKEMPVSEQIHDGRLIRKSCRKKAN